MATGDTPTTNYGWLKPPPHDAPLTWGVSLNADLDSIDSVVHALSLEVDTLNTGATTSNQLVLNKATVAAGNPIYGQLNGVMRWAIEVGDGSAESSGNAGSNFAIYRYDDTGMLIDAPFTLNRATGGVGLTGTLTCHNVSSWSVAVSPATSTDNSVVQFLVSGGAVAGYVGWVRSQAAIYLAHSSGVAISVAAGGITLGGATTVNGNLSATAVEASQGTARVRCGSNNAAQVLLNNNSTDLGQVAYDVSAGKMIMAHLTTGAALVIDSGSAFTFTGGGGAAYKVGGGTWAATSDARVKEVDVDYEAGLDEILRLRPVVYRYKGNDSYGADASSPHKEAAEAGMAFIGLVAQEAELAMPEIVSMREGYIDGEKVADLRTIDQSPLIFALINAVKELKAEIEELKRR
jgi:hypothetical protein